MRARIKANRLENLMARRLERELLVNQNVSEGIASARNKHGEVDQLLVRVSESAALFSELSSKSRQLNTCLKTLEQLLATRGGLSASQLQSSQEADLNKKQIENLLNVAKRQRKEIALLEKIRQAGASSLAEANRKIDELNRLNAGKDKSLRESHIMVSELETENQHLLDRIFKLESRLAGTGMDRSPAANPEIGNQTPDAGQPLNADSPVSITPQVSHDEKLETRILELQANLKMLEEHRKRVEHETGYDADVLEFGGPCNQKLTG